MAETIVRRFLLLALLVLCSTTILNALEKKNYKVYIVLDTIDIWSKDIRDGAKRTLDDRLAAAGAKAVYTEFDTKVDSAEVPAIIQAIKTGKPDIIIMAVYPDGFADTQIAAKLPQLEFRFVSADPIPVQTGLIKSWAKPGGNVTGVGVFLQYNSQLRLAKTINPRFKKLVFYTWDAMAQLNDWFELELRQACKEEGVELVEFRRVKNIEEEYALFREVDKRGSEYFMMVGISSFVDKDGNAVDANQLEPKFIRENIRRAMFMSYDESATRLGGAVAGAVVIWSDIGAQLAEKALQILDGANPGDIPWAYPRKYNLVFNLQAAKLIGIELPMNLLGAAYRIYTDFSGTFTGTRN